MSLTFTGYNNSSNPLVADKTLNVLSALEGLDVVLKENTSVQKPTLLLRSTSNIPKNLNYFYIEEFERWYFVTDVRTGRNNLIEISGRTDVLSTAFWRKDDENKSRLGKCEGILYRSQKDYNLYIDDGYFKVKNKPKIQTHPFSNSFNTHSFVMMIAGT